MKNKIILSEDQNHALRAVMTFLTSKTEFEMALSGPAGTGKTFLTKLILKRARDRKYINMLELIMGSDLNLNVALTSSTNKAATVLSDATGEYAETIHKLLGLRVQNDYETGVTKVVKTKNSKVLENTFLIIDEAGMVNKQLLKTIQEQTYKCKVLYIGDAYQLAPVKENTSPVFTQIDNQIKLTTIQRQDSKNSIIPFASAFRKALDIGEFPPIASMGINVQHLEPKDFEQEIKNNFPKDMDPFQARILAWTNNRVHQYNNYIRSMHTSNPDFVVGEFLTTNNPIMKNELRVFKGDQVVEITKIKEGKEHNIEGWDIQLNHSTDVFQARQHEHVKQLLNHYASQKAWRDYFEIKDFFVDLRPYFSSTVNKAQGSTYKNVFIDVADIGRNTKNSEIARLMYTALTRASGNVYMRGELPDRVY